MTLISPGNPNDAILGIASFFVILISCGLAFGILSSLLINDRKKGHILLAFMIVGGIGSLIAFFGNYTALGIAALALYIIFSIITYFVIKRKKSKQ